jgi:2-keto-4-pentenoate hydratase/2-oxohepta-3-ene-1,7-dioic acid hydratase in catechol pathway
MKLKRFNINASPVIAVQYESRWITLNSLSGLADQTHDMIALLDQWPQLERKVEEALKNAEIPLVEVPEGAKPMLPFEPKSFRDFMLSEAHAINAGRGMVKRFVPKAYRTLRLYEAITRRTFPPIRPKPLWYKKPIYYLGDHLNFVTQGAEIVWPDYTRALDYEIELGFVITKPLMNASREEALGAIGGFVIVNDISARDVQLAEMSSGFGPQKSKHFINVMSAQIVTADEILPEINNLKAEVRINGKTVCTTGSDFRHHSIADALMHVSKGAQLHPGELFATGTLPGGCALENDNWLRVGDRIELTIDRIGTLSNTITG